MNLLILCKIVLSVQWFCATMRKLIVAIYSSRETFEEASLIPRIPSSSLSEVQRRRYNAAACTLWSTVAAFIIVHLEEGLWALLKPLKPILTVNLAATMQTSSRRVLDTDPKGERQGTECAELSCCERHVSKSSS